MPTFYDKFPEWFQVIFDSGIIAAAITAVLLSIVFNIIGRKTEAEAPIFAEGPAVAAISQEDEQRLEGEEPVDRGQARRARDGSTRSEIDLPPQPEQQGSETPKQ